MTELGAGGVALEELSVLLGGRLVIPVKREALLRGGEAWGQRT